MDSYSHIIGDAYLTGLQGIQKFMFRLFTNFVKKDINYQLSNIRDLEMKFDISIQPPYSEFQLLTE